MFAGDTSDKDRSQPGKLESSTDWLKQLDAVLPGYTLKSELDILSLLTQVCILGCCFFGGGERVPFFFFFCLYFGSFILKGCPLGGKNYF